MNRRAALSMILMAMICCSCSKKPETLVKGGYDEKEMEAAIARARSEINDFVGEMTKGNGESFAVKAPIEDKGTTEHFWLTDITYKDGSFEGLIGNDPGMVTNVKLGQKWKIKKEEVSDWMFMRNGKMHGNYTMRPLLKAMPKDEAERMKSILANP